jgi:glycosyltransferase involved in cell wall biosynthesis
MRIGLLHLPEKSWGGVYQYSLSVIETLMKNDPGNDYVAINASGDTPELAGPGPTHPVPARGGLPGRITTRLYDAARNAFPLLPLFVPFGLTRLGRWMDGRGPQLDLLISPVPALHIDRLGAPYVVVIHDVMHRTKTGERQSRWPERLYRDVMYRRGAERSVLTVVFSEEGKADLARLYGIPPEKVRVIPCLPPPHVYRYKDLSRQEIDLTLQRFGLPERFIFYPAHFWRHKNHANLVRAMRLIRQEHGAEIPAVFVGSKREAFDEVMALANGADLGRQIFYLGFVSDKELVALFKRAVAMVIPTLGEVGSLPIVEALVLDTCCLCSNAPSLAEQGRGAALAFDPLQPQDIAKKVWAVWSDERLRRELVARGRRVVAERYTPEIFTRQWVAVINDAAKSLRRPRAAERSPGEGMRTTVKG